MSARQNRGGHACRCTASLTKALAWKKLPIASGIVRNAPTTNTSATKLAMTSPAHTFAAGDARCTAVEQTQQQEFVICYKLAIRHALRKCQRWRDLQWKRHAMSIQGMTNRPQSPGAWCEPRSGLSTSASVLAAGPSLSLPASYACAAAVPSVGRWAELMSCADDGCWLLGWLSRTCGRTEVTAAVGDTLCTVAVSPAPAEAIGWLDWRPSV